jgi:adenylate cyclase
MSLSDTMNVRLPGSGKLLSPAAFSTLRRNLRMASGLVLFGYISAHLINHALGLVSLAAAEAGLEYAVEFWYSKPGTILLYGAAATHFFLALWAVYERRTFRLPPAELLRIALGFTLPIILINHFANTRLAYDMFGLSSDYTRVIANLWIADSQGMQLGLLAPGWLHGCMGLHFAFSRRPLYRELRYILFAIALLVPVFSAFGFVAMGRELSTNPTAAAAARDYMGSAHVAERVEIARWDNQLVIGYFAIIGATFGARAVRNLLERGRKQLVSISYPGRTVQVPRGWSVLEASRSFHLPHASMCGGRARCSTCRVRVTAGQELCSAIGHDEQVTLRRIAASPDVRLACQLRPSGDISVVTLVQTARPVYRAAAPAHPTEDEIVVLVCDFLTRDRLAHDQLPQDLLHLLTLYGEALGNAIRAADGTLISIGSDGVTALFGLGREPAQAARQALRAAAAIERLLMDLDHRLGRDHDRKINVAVNIHIGRAVIGEVGSTDPPALIAVGEAMDGVNELRKAAANHGKLFAISDAVTLAAGVDPAAGDKIMVESGDVGGPFAAWLSAAAPIVPSSRTRIVERRDALRRLWSG